MQWVEAYLAHVMAYRLMTEMRIALFAKLDALAPAYLLRRRSGDLVALATQDVETIEYFYAHTLTPAAVALLTPAAVLVVLAIVAWPVAVALFPLLAYVAIGPLFLRRRIDEIGARAREGLGRLTAHVADTIQGLSELVAFQAVGRRRAEFMEIVGAYQATRLEFYRDLSTPDGAAGGGDGARRPRRRRDGRVARRAPAPRSGRAAAAHAARGRGVPPGVGDRERRPPAGRHLRVDAAAPPRPPRAGHRDRRPGDPAAARARRVGDPVRPRDVRVSRDEARRARPSSAWRSRRAPPSPWSAPRAPARPPPRTCCCASGIPQSGSITLDGCDLRAYALDHLRRRIALVAQDTYLFNDTLRENVRLAKPDADDREIALALERAALTEMVESLPERLDTRVGERGVQLSGGQRQRVAIARAFLKNAPVLILDEATSHLDAINEALVRRALDDLMRDRTTIVIAHRLSTIRAADLIAVLDQGRLVETGTHTVLLRRGGLYADLVERQLGLRSAIPMPGE